MDDVDKVDEVIEDGDSSSWDGVESADDNAPYHILLTTQQKEALVALNDALHDGETMESLLERFHAVSMAIFTSQRADSERHRFHLPLEFFTIAFNIRKDGSIRKPASIAPNVTVQQYWAQFTILHNAVVTPGPTSVSE